MATVKPVYGMRDKVAELLAEGLSTVEIRERLRMTAGQVSGHLSRIRQDLGWQAC